MSEPVKVIWSGDRKHRIEFGRTPAGLYSFTEFIWKPSQDEVDRTFHGDGYWGFGVTSGIYDSMEAAERDARCELRWMRDDPGAEH